MAEGIIGDQEAARIARLWRDEERPDDPLGMLADTGEIVAASLHQDGTSELVRSYRTGELFRPSEVDADDLWRLQRYIAHHGERGPQPGWPSEDRGGAR